MKEIEITVFVADDVAINDDDHVKALNDAIKSGTPSGPCKIVVTSGKSSDGDKAKMGFLLKGKAIELEDADLDDLGPVLERLKTDFEDPDVDLLKVFNKNGIDLNYRRVFQGAFKPKKGRVSAQLAISEHGAASAWAIKTGNKDAIALVVAQDSTKLVAAWKAAGSPK